MLTPSSFLSLNHSSTEDRYKSYCEYCHQEEREPVSYEKFVELYVI